MKAVIYAFISLLIITIMVIIYFKTCSPQSERFDINPDIQNVFNDIYSKKIWGDHGGGSGSGSAVENTPNLRNTLTKFVIDKKISSFLDLPCGSCVWTSVWLEQLKMLNIKISYYGMDIANDAVMNCEKNMSELKSFHNIDIKIGDMSESILPVTDALLTRDTLQHLSYDNIFKSLKNFAKYNIKWYIIGGYNESSGNSNINNGECFDFNITREPFSLVPDSIIKEENYMTTGIEPNKYLFIFEGNNFRNQIAKFN